MSQEDLNRQAFSVEATELLTELESALLMLESQPDAQDIIDRVFRAMHTIKGSGAMFGFDDIAAFTHDVETVFDLVRNGELAVTARLLDLTLKARDHIANLLSASIADEEPDLEHGAAITRQLRELAGNVAPVEMPAPRADAAEEGVESTTLRIRFRPYEDIYLSGNNPLAILDEIRDLGETIAFPYMDRTPALESLNPERCFVRWDVICSTTEPISKVEEVFLFVEDDSDVEIHVIDQGGDALGEYEYKKLGEILLERGDLRQEDLRKILKEKRFLGEELVSAGVVSPVQVQAALTEQKVVRQKRESRQVREKTVETATSIRVAAEKLDTLVDLVGELVIVQAQISQMVSERRDASLSMLAEELGRLSDELRDSTLGIRMLPIGATFNKFRRLVRDLSAELGKEIELTTRGEETELDKTVIERLNDPLVHLLRNSIDHGVEQPEDRVARGKPRHGSILLTAEHSGGEVLICIKDDGKGIDAKAVLAKAVERGLVHPEAELSEKDIFNLLFLPGFSTAQQVTNVSGRGVGMDVVKRGIDQLRGMVEIESELGVGATITIKLPLTLAIIEGLQVKVGEEFYVIPLSLVEECVELIRKDHERNGEQIINLRGEIVPYIRLREWFDVPGEELTIEQIVIVGVQGARVGVVVDHVIGEHQTVIKSLGRLYKAVEGISGATIRGDGAMALILDVPKLVQSAVAAHSW